MSKERYKYQGTGLTVKERNIGKKLFSAYIKTYPHLDKLSDLQLLEELVFLELIQERYKEKIGNLSRNKSVKEASVIPTQLHNSLSDNMEQILKLKERLGLFADKRSLDAYQHIRELEEKFDIWKANHPLERKVTCPFCSEIFFLNIRTDKYKESKSPFFKDKILANPELYDAYKKGEITKERYAKIIGTSEDFVDWLVENIFSKKPEDK